ncbi:hypothetical protein Syun_014362 [Stephania yunnanensis]|uniref:Uncharacterized protein n=1 Tax=Stephania yunnanensis TaxID=152371 RepID=A0AAP0JLI2_9MAGN
MVNGFGGLEPIFGEAANAQSGSHPFLFHVHALDASRIRIHVTDFHSHTWEALLSVQQLEELRDNIGIGGSWSEFLDYFISSLKSDTVKLVVVKKRPGEMVDNHSVSEAGSSDETIARLTAHKSKGMPLLSISLERLMNSSANDAMSNLSLELFKAFKSRCNGTIKEDGSLDKLSKKFSTEQSYSSNETQEKDVRIQNGPDVSPLSKKQTIPKFDLSDKVLHAGKKLDSVSVSAMDYSLDNQSIPDSSPSKVSKRRTAPAYRRAKVRGAILDDNENSN